MFVPNEPFAAGRGFVAADEQLGAEAVVVLSHEFWMRRFGGDPAVVGETVSMDGRPRLVAGVAPAAFSFPGSERVDVYHPHSFPPVVSEDGREISSRAGTWSGPSASRQLAPRPLCRPWGPRLPANRELSCGRPPGDAVADHPVEADRSERQHPERGQDGGEVDGAAASARGESPLPSSRRPTETVCRRRGP